MSTEPPQLEGPKRPASLIAMAGRTLLSLALLSGAVAVFFLLGSAEPPPQAPPAAAAPLVETVAAEPHDTGLSFSVDGVVRPYRDLDVAAESGGRVVMKSRSCRVGRLVRAGEVLIQIDPRDYEFDVRRLEEELEQSQISADELTVEIESAKQQITLAEETVRLNIREVKRIEGIRTPGAVTESELDTARRDVVNARISLQSQRDQLRLLEARGPRLQSVVERTETEMAMAKLALERCVIRAPIDGVITEEHVEQDGYLQQGALVFTVRDTSRLDVRCSLRADQLALLWEASDAAGKAAYEFPETPVMVVYDIGSRSYAWDGVLARYDGAGLDEQTRMAPCLVHVDAPRAVKAIGESPTSISGLPPTLLVGMFVEVRVRLQPRSPLLSIPAVALHPGNQVWVVENEELAPRKARVADSTNGPADGTDRDAILVYAEPGGLAAGARVVVSPLASPAAGKRVRSTGLAAGDSGDRS